VVGLTPGRDGGDIDSGERSVHHRADPCPDRCTRRAATLNEPVNHLLAEREERGRPPPREQLLQRARGLLLGAGVLHRMTKEANSLGLTIRFEPITVG
jgi:hypothetical protein